MLNEERKYRQEGSIEKMNIQQPISTTKYLLHRGRPLSRLKRYPLITSNQKMRSHLGPSPKQHQNHQLCQITMTKAVLEN